jgi:hypothetical protein
MGGKTSDCLTRGGAASRRGRGDTGATTRVFEDRRGVSANFLLRGSNEARVGRGKKETGGNY